MSLKIPNNAPFSNAQRVWLQGYLDGVNAVLVPSAQGGAAAEAPAPAPAGVPVTIIWGSQTGSSESVSKKLAKKLKAEGHIPTMKDMAEVTPEDLQEVENLLVVTSTYGDGEPPDNALDFYNALHADTAPTYTSLKYSVFALGDSSYPDFCKCGADFDKRFAALGATQLTPIVECDVDYDDEYAAWTSQLSGLLKPA